MQTYISDAPVEADGNDGKKPQSKYTPNRYMSLVLTPNQHCTSTFQVDLKIAIFYLPAFEEVMTFFSHMQQANTGIDVASNLASMQLFCSCYTRHAPTTPDHIPVCYASNGRAACFEEKRSCRCHDASLP